MKKVLTLTFMLFFLLTSSKADNNQYPSSAYLLELPQKKLESTLTKTAESKNMSIPSDTLDVITKEIIYSEGKKGTAL